MELFENVAELEMKGGNQMRRVKTGEFKARGLFIKLSFLVSLFLFSVFSAATPGAAAEYKWPKTLNVVSLGVGTSSYVVTVGWGHLIEKATGMKLRVTPLESRAEHLRWLKNGNADLIADPITEAVNSIVAEKEFATKDGGPFQIRFVWQYSTNPFSYFVRGDSDIKTIYDIKPEGKRKRRISTITAQPAYHVGSLALCAWLGIDPEKDVIWVPVGSYANSLRAVGEGKADVTYASPESTVMVELEAIPQGIRWLTLPVDKDPAGMKRYLNMRPQAILTTINTGVKSANGVIGSTNALCYLARADTDTEFMYNLAKWFGEQYNVYKNVHKVMEDHMGLSSLRKTLDFMYVPVHEGVIKYLKEKNMWNQADDARQDYNVKLVGKYIESFKIAMTEAEKKGIKIDSSNSEWLNLWEGYRKKLDVPKVQY